MSVPFETTLEVAERCLCFHSQRAARALARHFDAAFRPFGLTSGQFSLLMAINRPQPPTMAPVADTLAVDRTTLTALVKVLERRGLLLARPDPSDRRGRQLVLTPAGHAALSSALPVWRDEMARFEARLGAGAAPVRAGLWTLAQPASAVSSPMEMTP